MDPWLHVIDGDGKLFALGNCAHNQGGLLLARAQVSAQQGKFLAHILNAGNHMIDFVNGMR